DRRRRHPPGARISVTPLLGPSLLSGVPEPARDVRSRSRVSVYPAISAADRPALQRLAALAQHHVNECCYCCRRCRTDLVHRRLALPACALTNYFARRFSGSMAVLRAASIREDVLGA